MLAQQEHGERRGNGRLAERDGGRGAGRDPGQGDPEQDVSRNIGTKTR